MSAGMVKFFTMPVIMNRTSNWLNELTDKYRLITKFFFVITFFSGHCLGLLQIAHIVLQLSRWLASVLPVGFLVGSSASSATGLIIQS